MNKQELEAYDAMMSENDRLRAINEKRLEPSLVVTKCEMRGKEILKVGGCIHFSQDDIGGFTDLKEDRVLKTDNWTYYLETKGLLKEGKRYELIIREFNQ